MVSFSILYFNNIYKVCLFTLKYIGTKCMKLMPLVVKNEDIKTILKMSIK